MEVALSTDKAEYIVLSQFMCEFLLKGINEIFPLHIPTTEIYCKTWEYDNGCIALVQNHNFHLVQSTLPLNITIF